jgi:hypothetical protein
VGITPEYASARRHSGICYLRAHRLRNIRFQHLKHRITRLGEIQEVRRIAGNLVVAQVIDECRMRAACRRRLEVLLAGVETSSGG